MNHNQKSSREALLKLQDLLEEQDRRVSVKHLQALAMARIGISEVTFKKYIEILVELKEIKVIECYIFKPTQNDKIAPLNFDYK